MRSKLFDPAVELLKPSGVTVKGKAMPLTKELVDPPATEVLARA